VLRPEPDGIVKTGIHGLDAILLGGIPRGNVVILSGSPGTGKTTLGIEFVYHGARDFDEPGIIVTFEVSSEKLVRDAAQFGWDLGALQEQGRLKIISTTRRVFQQEVQEPDSLLLTDANRMGAKRIFVDGLAGVTRNGNGDARELFHILVEALHRESVTAMFALDAPADRAAVGAMPEDFIGDTIIRLGREPVRLGDRCGAHTFPYIEVGNASSIAEHEASTSKISDGCPSPVNRSGRWWPDMDSRPSQRNSPFEGLPSAIDCRSRRSGTPSVDRPR
jgi:KaiC/GvpD/RAD55 family RecA-like ATPase